MSQSSDRASACVPPAVLVGVDGSDASRTVIEAAAQEARCRGAPLIAVRAYSGERAVTPSAAATVLSSLRAAVHEVLGDRAAEVEVRAVLGLAGRRIVETARQVNAQLIVLATRGSPSLLLGTVSQYVLRRAPCAVLIIPVPPAQPAS